MRIIIILLFLVASCKKPVKPDDKSEEKVTASIESYVSDLDSFSSGLKDSLSDPEFLKSLYTDRNFKPYWFKHNHLSRAADSLIMYMNNAHLFGLNPAYYRTRFLTSARGRKIQPDSAAYFDIIISDAFIKFMTEIHAGKLDTKGRIVFKGRSLRYYLRPLIEAASKKNQVTRIVHAFEPLHPFYKKLKQKLYHLAVFRNDLHELASRQNLNESDTLLINPFIRELHRLHMEVPEIIPDPSEFTDIQGKINYLKENLPKVKASINIALEKWRWEKRDFPRVYVLVNIASYQLHMFDQKNIVFNTKIVVGKPENPTPELESEISAVQIYPMWHVPYSIASKEILPLIQSDMEYLFKQNMEVLDKDENIVDPDEIDWSEYDERNLPFRFRQRQGEGNALGVLKFYFYNKYGVYMHDTNEKRYFKKQLRAFSHGCIRVDNPKKFAGYLLKRSDSISAEIDRYLNKRQSRSLPVNEPVPVYIRYFTSEVSNDTLHIFPDIYKKEKDLLRFYSL